MVHSSMLQSAAATNFAFPPSAQRRSPRPRSRPKPDAAQRATELAQRRGLHVAGPSRPTLGPSALAGRRLATAVAGLQQKASKLFELSCTYYSCIRAESENERDRECAHESNSEQQCDLRSMERGPTVTGRHRGDSKEVGGALGDTSNQQTKL